MLVSPFSMRASWQKNADGKSASQSRGCGSASASTASRGARVDSFDIIEDLNIQRGSFVNVLTAISLHGGLCEAWPKTQITAKNTLDSLLSHWRGHGLPTYAKFDNDPVFQGTHAWPYSF